MINRVVCALLATGLPVVPANADVPRLAQGTQVGVLYGSGDPVSGPNAQVAFSETLSAGSSVYVLEIGWNELEPIPGVIDTAPTENFLQIIQSLGLSTYVNISIVDSGNITVPSDLADPNNPLMLANGLSWDDPAVVSRVEALVDAVAPLMQPNDGFFLGFGNEIDAYFLARPGDLPAYLSLISAARARAKAIDPALACGVSVTRGAIQSAAFTAQVWPVCDAASYTYFPVDAGFNVLPPTGAPGALDDMLADAGSLPVLLQRVGYPSGVAGAPTNGSSEAMQAQFVQELDAAVRERPRVRAVSWYLLNDWSDQTLDAFEAYFGINSPAFREYLGSLGLLTVNGATKDAYDDMLTMLMWCPPDLDSSGVRDSSDVVEMLGRVGAAGNAGDFDANGVVDFADAIEYMRLFDEGCD